MKSKSGYCRAYRFIPLSIEIVDETRLACNVVQLNE